MAWADLAETSARKYVVSPWLSGWRVTLDDAKAGDFTGMAEAVAFACSLARDHAYAGVAGIVVVEARVKELHCFTPGPTAPRAGRRLRLVASAGSD